MPTFDDEIVVDGVDYEAIAELEEQLMYPYESEPLNDVELDDYCNQFNR